MKPIRVVSALALGFGVAGCAATPSFVPVETAAVDTVPVVQTDAGLLAGAVALPEFIEAAPEPQNTAAAPVPQDIDLGPYDAPTAVAAVPVSVAAPAPAPVPVVVQTQAVAYTEVPAATVAAVPERSVSAAPAYTLASPGFTQQARPLGRGQMAPVRDDPVDTDAPRVPRSTTYNVAALKAAYQPSEARSIAAPAPRVRNAHTPAFGNQLSDSALSRLNPNVAYVAAYKKIGYPWGDVSEDTGVCTDVVIRSYRGLGIDLQSMVHEDMKRAFSAYPSKKIYGLKKADPNIDHRRVVNLEAFFERVGAAIPLGSDYQPGDVITWRLSGGEPHIGVVVNRRDPKTGNPMIVHNLGAGVRAEDLLDYAQPHGAYRFAPDQQSRMASLALKRG